jgi:hypothetical protein
MGKTKEYKKLIDKKPYDLELYKVVYKTVDIPEDIPGETVFKLKTRDNYRILNITEKRIEIEFKREQYFEPKAVFEIEISIRTKYEIKKDKEKNVSKIIEDQFKKDIDDYLRPAAIQSSIIVSNLTNINFRTPIVSPPFPVLERGEDEEQ